MNHAEMRLIERVHAALRERAAETRVDQLVVGLGYTAVSLEDGGSGLAYTWRGPGKGCSHLTGLEEAEGAPAAGLLDLLLSDDGLERSVGLATANAVNHARALGLPPDDGPAGALIRELGIVRGTRVSMVGHFAPVARVLTEVGVQLDVVDDAKGIGDRASFARRLDEWTEALVVTSTTLLGGTADELLGAVPDGVRVGLLGPTTPMLPEVFGGTPVALLCGMVPQDVQALLRAVRHGAGTRQFQRHCRKVYCRVASGVGDRGRA